MFFLPFNTTFEFRLNWECFPLQGFESKFRVDAGEKMQLTSVNPGVTSIAVSVSWKEKGKTTMRLKC